MLFNIFNRKILNKKDEKRKFLRVDLFQASYCKLDDDLENARMFDCWLNNLSIGGICFDLNDEALEQGDKIVILYKLGQKVRRDKAVIRHKKRAFNNWRYGGEFYESDPKRDSIILNYIESLKETH